MTSIIILEAPEEQGVELSRTDYDIFYDNIKSLKILKEFVVDSFKEIKIDEDKERIISSDIPSIILNNIIRYTRVLSDGTGIDTLSSFPVLGYKNEKKSTYPVKYSSNENIKVSGIIVPRDLYPVNIPFDTIDNFLLCNKRSIIYFSGLYGQKEHLYRIHYNDYFNALKPLIYLDPDVKHSLESDNMVMTFKDQSDLSASLTQVSESIRFINEFKKKGVYGLHIYLKRYYSKYQRNSPYRLFNDEKANSIHTSDVIKKLSGIIGLDLSRKTYNETIYLMYKYNVYDVYQRIISLTADKHEDIFSSLEKCYKDSRSLDSQISKLEEVKLEYEIKKNLALNKFQMNIGELSDSQLKAVEIAYKQKTKKREDGEENPSVKKLYTSVETDNNVLAREALEELGLSETEEKADSVVCPHIVDYARMLAEEKDSVYILEEILEKYAIENNLEYYCTTCGQKLYREVMSDISVISIDNFSNDNEFDEMYKNVYREVVFLGSSYLDLSLITGKNANNIFKTISTSIKPDISSIQATLYRVKTLDIPIKELLSVYIYIYIFASFTQLIYYNKGIIDYKNNKSPIVVGSRENSSDKQRLKSIINQSLNLAKTLKSSVIMKTNYIDFNEFRTIFLQAYKKIVNSKYSAINVDEQSFFIHNNIIDYYVYAHNQSGTGDRLDKITYNMAVMRDDFSGYERVLGRKYDEIEKSLLSDEIIGILDTVIAPEEKWGSSYSRGSFMLLHGLIKDSFVDEKEREKLIKEQKQIERNHIIDNLLPYISFPYRPQAYSIKKLCNCKGRCKKRFYYKKLKDGQYIGEKKEFTVKDIDTWIKTRDRKKLDEFSKWHVSEIEYICPEKSDDREKAMFYDYFYVKCPIEGVHRFKNGVCDKCGITSDMSRDKDDKYYKKYHKLYAEMKQKEKELKEKGLNMVKKKTSAIRQVSSLNVDTNVVDRFIKNNVNLSYNEFYNIGSYEGRTMKEVKDSIIKQDTTLDMARKNNYILNYIIFVLRHYNILRNYNNIYKPPALIKDFVGKHKTFQYSKLPTVGINVVSEVLKTRKTSTEKDVTNYLLKLLVDVLLEIDNSIKDPKISKDFVDLMVKSIIDSEKKLIHFEVKRYKSSPSSAVDTEFTVDDNEEEGVENSEQTEDIFSVDDIDMEYDEDNINTNYADF
jgi:hypothetical protein